MRVLVVENMNNTRHGHVGMALAEAGADLDIRRPRDGEKLPGDAGSHDAIVVFGGEQNALDDAGHPYLPDLAALMRGFAEADKAVLGICLGSQLLARGFGGQNLIGAASEFGWRTIRARPEALSAQSAGRTEAGPANAVAGDTGVAGEGNASPRAAASAYPRVSAAGSAEPHVSGAASPTAGIPGADPLIAAVTATDGAFVSFQWHDDTFTLPADAVHLAENDAARHQAFRIGRAAYGMQFHFEADRDVVSEWIRQFPAMVERRSPGWADGGYINDAQTLGAQADRAGLAMARAWVALI